MKNEVQSR